MDYAKLYQEKLVTAEQAAAVAKSGDRADDTRANGTPIAVDTAIAKRLPALENVNFRGDILMWTPEIFKLESRIQLTLTPGSIVTNTRTYVHCPCTEYGCVNLKGLTTRERAEAICIKKDDTL